MLFFSLQSDRRVLITIVWNWQTNKKAETTATAYKFQINPINSRRVIHTTPILSRYQSFSTIYKFKTTIVSEAHTAAAAVAPENSNNLWFMFFPCMSPDSVPSIYDGSTSYQDCGGRWWYYVMQFMWRTHGKSKGVNGGGAFRVDCWGGGYKYFVGARRENSAGWKIRWLLQ